MNTEQATEQEGEDKNGRRVDMSIEHRKFMEKETEDRTEK